MSDQKDRKDKGSAWNSGGLRSGDYLQSQLPMLERILASKRIRPRRLIAKMHKECSELAVNWFYSRDFELLYAALPVLLLSVVAFLITAWAVSRSDTPSVIRNYRSELIRSTAAGNAAKQEVCLRGLRQLDPKNSSFAIELADLLVQTNRVSEAVECVTPYAPLTGAGSVDARLWLIRKSRSGDERFKMSSQDVLNQLLAVLRESRGNIEATEILSQTYIQEKEWRLAERTLQAAAEVHPEVNLTLLKLQRLLNRPQPVQEKTSELAIAALREQLRAEPSDVTTRGHLAEALFLADKVDDAREVLMARIEQTEDSEMKLALSRMEMLVANRLLRQSPANRDACCALVVRALTMDPSSTAALDLLRRLDRMGALIRPDSLSIPLKFWQERAKAEESPYQSIRAAAQILQLMKKERDAAALMLTDLDSHPEDRLFVAELLQASGQSAEADGVAETLLADLRKQVQSEPGNVLQRITLAKTLLLLKKPVEAREVLVNTESSDGSRVPANPEAAAVYGLACVAEFDEKTGLSGKIDTLDSEAMPLIADRATAKPLIQLLNDAVRSGPVSERDAASLQAIDRLTRLALSRVPGAKDADGLLTDLRAEGIHTLEILNTLSARSLALERYDLAVKWLEIANGIAEEKNPAILNNLAVAEVRSTPSKPMDALKHVNQSLKIMPNHPDILSTRGEIYVALNDWKSAMEDLRTSLALRPDRPAVHRLMAQTFAASGQIQEARVHQLQAERLEQPARVD